MSLISKKDSHWRKPVAVASFESKEHVSHGSKSVRNTSTNTGATKDFRSMVAEHRIMNATMTVVNGDLVNLYKLQSPWNIYCHIPNNNDWSMEGYVSVMKKISSLEEGIALCEVIPDALLRETIFFTMRENITPMWEDPQNVSGGSFSFKLLMKQAPEIYRNTFFALIGGFLCKDLKQDQFVNGISLSPKRNFCILKIWMKTCKLQDVSIISDIPGLIKERSLFRAHVTSG
jgi:hypothetical protein